MGRKLKAGVAGLLTVAAAASLGVFNQSTASADPDIWVGGIKIGGKIVEEYNQNRALGFNYGNPTSSEANALNEGKFQIFANNARIYWHPLVSGGHANTVGGRIKDRWEQQNWEHGTLKYPTTREIPVTGGAFNHFEGGSIYWSPANDAKITWGAIRQKWWDTGAEGNFGFPVSEEFSPARYGGKAQTFERASIYWTAATGAHPVGGEIGNIWGAANWENGNYGYPVTDEFDIPGGRRQVFQGGPIDFYWDHRPVGKIQMSTFRWQDFIPEQSLSTRCDIEHLSSSTVISESYNGNNRSWDPEGTFKVRMDAYVYVNQNQQGAKSVEFGKWTEPTIQTMRLVKVLPPFTETQVRSLHAGTETIYQTAHGRLPGDYPDVVRFRFDSLATNPFCDAPVIDDGIRAQFNAGFSGSTGAFWIDGDRRRMPNAEVYTRDWVTPGNDGWKQKATWVKDGPLCLINDSNCGGRQRVDSASSNWNGGSIY